MKKILALILFLSACSKQQIDNEKIYLFYSQNCGYCHIAMDYIAKKHPKLEVEIVDVAKGNGYQLMKACAEKHNLGNRIGTPLFCMGDDYLMGWSDSNIIKFDDLAPKFKKQPQP